MAEPGLTTHILDTARGKPAAGVRIELFAIEDGRRRKIVEAATNLDGKTDRPLLGGGSLPIGVFELVFHIGDYHLAIGAQLADPPFLDQIALRFGISERSGHYHVPLLVSPWSYSTYRGS